MYHWHELRALTNRERARSKRFQIGSSWEQGSVRKQIGMAIPPEGMRVIRMLLACLNNGKYRSVPSNVRIEDWLK